MTDLLPVSLYIHYPWCIRKCPYCDFNSYPKNKSVCTDESYLKALILDFKENLKLLSDRRFNAVYFGGGTPSLFPPALMEKLLKEILREKLHDIGFGNHCLDMTPEAQATKEKNVFLLFDVRRHQNSKLVCIKGHCQQNEKATHSIG